MTKNIIGLCIIALLVGCNSDSSRPSDDTGQFISYQLDWDGEKDYGSGALVETPSSRGYLTNGYDGFNTNSHDPISLYPLNNFHDIDFAREIRLDASLIDKTFDKTTKLCITINTSNGDIIGLYEGDGNALCITSRGTHNYLDELSY